MRIVFMGTPEFAVPSLRALAEHHDVVLVVTRPDAVRGRGKKLVPSAVKAVAQELGLEVLEAAKADAAMVERVVGLKPDVICVAAYGALLPDDILLCAPHGCVNVHASLLPRGRGAAPIQRALLEGDDHVGVSIMRLVKAMDAGPYCRQGSLEVEEHTCPTIMSRLAELGAQELVGALEDMEARTVEWIEQDECLVTYAAKIEKSEMLLDPADAALVNRHRVQASLDAAPARLVVGGRGVRVLDARVVDQDVDSGAVVVAKRRVFLGCADGALELLSVKPDGKRQMSASDWSAGLRGNLTWERVAR